MQTATVIMQAATILMLVASLVIMAASSARQNGESFIKALRRFMHL